jgi:rhamnose transport system substrate-binding protein
MRSTGLARWAAVPAAALLIAACGETKNGAGPRASTPSPSATADPAAPLKRGLEFVSIPKVQGNPYEQIEHGGIRAAMRELGGSDRVEAPSDTGASSQVPIITSVTQHEPDAIIIAGNDPNAVAPALEQAARRGIKIVSMDSDVAAGARSLFVNQASSEAIGRQQVQMLARQMHYEGEWAILSSTPNATNQNTWIEYIKAEARKPRYARMKLVRIAYGNDEDRKSFQETQGLIQAYPHLEGISAPTSFGVAAAARYLSTSPAKGRVHLTGLGTPNQLRAYVKDGTVTQFALWYPPDVGYLAGYAAAALVSGQITGARGERFTAGRLGTRTIGAAGEVILGPPTVFDKRNIDRYHF